jgi:hypothetical protein
VTPALDPALHLALRAGLALLLLAAAAHKLRDPHRFRAVLADYRLLPRRTLEAVARTLPAGEAALALALLAPGLGATPALLVATLLALYAAAIAINLARGRRHIDCGCLGAAARRPLGFDLVARNALLAVAAGAAAPAAAVRPLVWLDAVTVVGGVLAGALLFAALGATRDVGSPATLRGER